MRSFQASLPGWAGHARLGTYLLAGGLVVSAGLCAALYALVALIHPPAAFGHPGSPPTVDQWISSYATWSSENAGLTTGYRAFLLVAIGFASALAVFTRPRGSLVVAFAALNVYFAWSSSTFAFFSKELEHVVSQSIYLQDGYVLSYFDLRVYTGDTYIVADLEALAFLAVVMGASLVLKIGDGLKTAALHAVRAGAACFLILGTEIALFDYREFYLHLTQTQAAFGLATWFTNADLFLVGLVVLAATTYGLRGRGLRSSLY